MTTQAGWGDQDAALLVAIARSGRTCPVGTAARAAEQVLGADLPHAVLQASLDKVVGAGLVRVFEGWTLELTEEGSALCSVVEGSGLRERVQDLLLQLGNVEPGSVGLVLPASLGEVEDHEL